ncbi:FtsX-like permease family protein [Arthrobacter sp. StoSoilB5]|uniref:ABC transporter permease n=1 Tax=Arthrobacter sp. StoSoilB5 TaxID=2830992 RepID=UPI001CC42323|nr:FtsX-like permease family protein [Arthrobacter sp. StoSoilB5]
MTRRKLAKGLALRDLTREAWLSTYIAPARSLLTSVGVVLGCLSFVAALGLTSTIGQQVSTSFDVRRATTVTAELDEIDTGQQSNWITADGLKRTQQLAGTASCGRVDAYSGIPVAHPYSPDAERFRLPLFGLDAGSLQAVGLRMVAGRSIDAGHVTRADRVVLLSANAARQIGVRTIGAAVDVGGLTMTLAGIYDDADRLGDTIGGAIAPQSTLAMYRTDLNSTKVIVETTPGAAEQVGGQLALALSPGTPDRIKVVAPPDPKTLRQEVSSNVTLMALLVSTLTLFIGCISIGNAAMAAMSARIPEFGLRRAMGARRVDIFTQVLMETTMLGIVGGAVGSSLGSGLVLMISLINRWVPVLDAQIVICAMLGGTVSGVLAGLWPALRATKISPVQALAR